jgi:hypothetical protein
MQHRVRVHRWVEGRLQVLDDWFDSLEQAMAHATGTDGHMIKIYNPEGSLLDTKHNVQVPTPVYA